MTSLESPSPVPRCLEDIISRTPVDDDVDPDITDITIVFSSDTMLASIAQLPTIATLIPTVVTGATDADKALILKRWIDEVMVAKAKIKQSCLVEDPLTGDRMYGLFRGMMGWNVNKFEAHITLFTAHCSELMNTNQSWEKYTKSIGDGVGNVSTDEIKLAFFLG